MGKSKLKHRQLERVIGGAGGIASSPSFGSLGVSVTSTPCNNIWGPANQLNYYFYPQGAIVSVDKRGTSVKQVNYAIKDGMPSRDYAEKWMGGAANFKNFYTGNVGSWPGWGTSAWKA